MKRLSCISLLLLCLLTLSVGGAMAQGKATQKRPSLQEIIGKIETHPLPLSKDCLTKVNYFVKQGEVFDVADLDEDAKKKMKEQFFKTRYWEVFALDGSYVVETDENGRKFIAYYEGSGLGEGRAIECFEFKNNSNICIAHIFDFGPDGLELPKHYYTMELDMSRIVLMTYDANGVIITYEWGETYWGFDGYYMRPYTKKELKKSIAEFLKD